MTLPCRLIIDEGPLGEGNQDKLGLICHCKMIPHSAGQAPAFSRAGSRIQRDRDDRVMLS